MNMFIIVFATAFAVALISTPIAIKLAPKVGAIDVPKDERRMHTRPMPRFGGLAIYLGTMVTVLLYLPLNEQLWGVIISGTLIYMVGVYDDIKGMPAKVKFVAQILCACVLFQFSIRISGMAVPFAIGSYYASFPLALSLFVTVLWIVGITNTVNLIDGLDGLAAGIAMIACLSIAYTAFLHERYEPCYIMLAIAGASLGFLPYNFNPAKIFMGDGGSLFLGFMLAGVSIMGDTPLKSTTVIATIVPMFVLALPIFDTAFAILRRMVNKRPIMEADKGHLHHRIMSVGLGQKRTVLMLYSISAIMGVAAVLISIDTGELMGSGRVNLMFEAGALVVIAATLIFVFLDNHKIMARQQQAIDDAIEELERHAAEQEPGTAPEETMEETAKEVAEEVAEEGDTENENNDGIWDQTGGHQDGAAGKKAE